MEFEDSGWYWISKVMYPDSEGSGISVWSSPNFNCRMMIKEDEYVPAELRDYIDVTGEISSEGEIVWDTKEVDTKKSEIKEELKKITPQNYIGI